LPGLLHARCVLLPDQVKSLSRISPALAQFQDLLRSLQFRGGGMTGKLAEDRFARERKCGERPGALTPTLAWIDFEDMSMFSIRACIG